MPQVCARLRSSTWLLYFLTLSSDPRQQRSPLLWATCAGRGALVSALLDAQANVEARDDHNRSALMLAVKHGHTDVVRRLMGGGADTVRRAEPCTASRCIARHHTSFSVAAGGSVQPWLRAVLQLTTVIHPERCGWPRQVCAGVRS